MLILLSHIVRHFRKKTGTGINRGRLVRKDDVNVIFMQRMTLASGFCIFLLNISTYHRKLQTTIHANANTSIGSTPQSEESHAQNHTGSYSNSAGCQIVEGWYTHTQLKFYPERLGHIHFLVSFSPFSTTQISPKISQSMLSHHSLTLGIISQLVRIPHFIALAHTSLHPGQHPGCM